MVRDTWWNFFKSSFGIYGMIAIGIFLAVCITGYATNIYYITQVINWGGLEVLRVIGVLIAPLGVILGLLSPFIQ